MPVPAHRRLPFAPRGLSASFVDLLGGLVDREPPREFRVFTKGVNGSSKGDFLFDQQAADGVLSAFAEHGIDLVIDYDHAALAAPMVKVEAAGWIKGLEVRNGDLWATGVSWTAAGEKDLRAGAYRYISPTFDWDEKTGRVGKLITVSLLNTPALFGLDALVAAGALIDKGESMDPELKKAHDRAAELERQLAVAQDEVRALKGQNATAALSSTIGLGASATADEVRAGVVALAQLRGKVLELTGKDSIPAALGTVEGWKSEAADAGRLKREKDEIEQAGFKKEIDTLLDQASKDGKIPPAERPGWEKDALFFGGGKASKDGVAWLSARVTTLVPKTGGNAGASNAGASNAGAGGVAVQKGGRAALSQSESMVARVLRIPEKDWQDWDNKQTSGT
jgi:phage I-like protein